MKRFFTIGMAGHIDHGKTTLTKSLTGIDTDRLKEEKERHISIEPGYALLIDTEKVEVALVDVPGHERFIRQMIAGVAGIDFVILVIAADEGVMPQTKEHLNILSLLGIERGIVVMTKVAETEEELIHLVRDDIIETLKGTFLQDKPLFKVDSLTGEGISELQKYLQETVPQLPTKNSDQPFRFPVDQVFTLKGQGVIVRGTIFDGTVTEGDELTLLPSGKTGRVRQIQSHNKRRKKAFAGQRAAINIGGIPHQQIKRGDVFAHDDLLVTSNRIDVVLYPLKGINYQVKQRLFVKVHVGTSEVNGTIIFFDRNELQEKENAEVLCQLQLDEEVVAKRGDRFIIRRATPVETIGGGWIIEPNAKKYRFGDETIKQLKVKKEGTAEERILLILNKKTVLSAQEIINEAAVTEDELNQAEHLLLKIAKDNYTTIHLFEQLKEKIVLIIENYHEQYPLRRGINKAELVSALENDFAASMIDFTIEQLIEKSLLNMAGEFVFKSNFIRTYPDEWEKQLKKIEYTLVEQGAQLDKWDDLMAQKTIPDYIQTDFYYFLIETEKAFIFDDERLISKKAIKRLKEKLAKETERSEFNLQTARSILQLSRKNLIPLLELFDELGYTKRDGNIRGWC